jgi:hypothetical protein
MGVGWGWTQGEKEMRALKGLLTMAARLLAFADLVYICAMANVDLDAVFILLFAILIQLQSNGLEEKS